MAIEEDCAKECELKLQVEEHDLLLDIKALISEYYVATFNDEGGWLKISLNNGQSFKIIVSEFE